ncbi:hypothetical protein IJT93_02390 [bacterium]|nr:hypothetical protein [bacterium]
MNEPPHTYKLSEEAEAELLSRAEQARQLLKIHGRSSEGLKNLFAPLPQIRQTLAKTLAAGLGSPCDALPFMRGRAAAVIQEISSVLAQWPKNAEAEAFAGRRLSAEELALAEKTLALRSRFEELRRLMSVFSAEAPKPPSELQERNRPASP